MIIIYQDPWLAVNLSMFFPGIGQIYAKKQFRGLFWMISQILLIFIAIWSIFAPEGNTIIGLADLLLISSLYIANLFDAYHCIYYQLPHKSSEKIPRTYKNPWFAVFLSRILPGLGHLYLEKSLAAILFLIATICLTILDDSIPQFLVFPPLIAALATYHVYRTFTTNKSTAKFRSIPVYWLAILAACVFNVGLLINYLPYWIGQNITPFEIPSSSMLPTLQIGDRILVTQSQNYQPQRRDLVVFETPENAKKLDPSSSSKITEFYIKRMIGKPGETVWIHQGVVSIDGQSLLEDYIKESPNYEWGPTQVPANHYLVLGDNRNDSFDSHVWGFLDKKYLIGKAYKIYWPPQRIQSLIISK